MPRLFAMAIRHLSQRGRRRTPGIQSAAGVAKERGGVDEGIGPTANGEPLNAYCPSPVSHRAPRTTPSQTSSGRWRWCHIDETKTPRGRDGRLRLSRAMMAEGPISDGAAGKLGRR